MTCKSDAELQSTVESGPPEIGVAGNRRRRLLRVEKIQRGNESNAK
jgi:hypothetical protein